MDMKDRIKSRRLELGYTLEYVAKLVGTSKQTIHRYETGTISNIPSDKIEALARALSTTPAYLMGWTDDGGQEENMKKITANTYTLTTDEEEILIEYVSLSEEGKAELKKHLELLLKVYHTED